jgi:hypothetical protein
MRRHGEQFFSSMAILMIVLVVGGFGTTLLTRTSAVLSLPMVVHLHGAVFLSWFLCFFLQARFVRAGNMATHRRIGQFSLGLGLLMILFGYLVTRGAYAKPDFSIAGLSPSGSTIYPSSDILAFASAYFLGIATRRNSAAHKRFMLLAGLLILDPAVSRIILVGLHWPGSIIVPIEGALIGILLVYDVSRLRQLHWASLIGMGLFAGMIVLKMTQGEQAWWHSTAKVLFG